METSGITGLCPVSDGLLGMGWGMGRDGMTRKRDSSQSPAEEERDRQDRQDRRDGGIDFDQTGKWSRMGGSFDQWDDSRPRIILAPGTEYLGTTAL